MKKIYSLFVAFLSVLIVQAQEVKTPDFIWGPLFVDVQLQRVFPDNKTFVDCTPRYAPEDILRRYSTAKDSSGFSLKAFIAENFTVPRPPVVQVTGGLSLSAHVEELWNTLSRKRDTVAAYSSLLPLPKPYIVPGGRFREIYYWDSYFTMQGLAVSNRYDLIGSMLDNFEYLIDSFGHIPNGNRSYYLSRSQPPFFALMVELLQEKGGDSIFRRYLPAMEKEYNWWMEGSANLKPGAAHRRVVRMPDGTLLNRYWDDKVAPREESHVQDVETAEKYKSKDGKVFTNLRAGAESGWDFSSRWFRDTATLATIETTDILPVDLNSLLYACEVILSKAAKANGQAARSDMYAAKAAKRKAALRKYFWDPKAAFFFDYHLLRRKTTGRWSAAGAMPLFCNVASKEQAAGVKRGIETKLLKAGGVVTTPYKTGQQWDAPNGWAPLQFIAVKGLGNYGHHNLARTIAQRWMAVNEKVFKATGKMLEKYNVENMDLESGGGEYPTQDGFGWSNGVYLKFAHMFDRRPVL